MKAKKSLGQNFISDPNLISAIADAAAIEAEDTVVEIGPGRGALTLELADRAKALTAVELDADLIPILRAVCGTRDNITIVNEDILKFDFSGIDQENLRIVGNLPYYITTPIILGLLEKGVKAKSMTFMVQKEVAERIVSPPGSKDYGVLSISVQYYCNAQYMLDVGAEYFNPRPKVDSAVVNLTPKGERLLAPEDEALFFSMVKTAFSQRRKTLQNTLTGFCGFTKESLGEVLEAAGVEASRRPETLSLEEFAVICGKIKERKNA